MNPQDFTTAEAAFVTGRPLAAIRKAVSERKLRARTRGADRAGARLLGLPELRYLRALEHLQDRLSAGAQGELYDRVRALSAQEHEVHLGLITVDLTEVDRDVEARLDRLRALRETVEGHGSREPLVRGTSIPVYVISALVEGGGVEEAIYAYPSLSLEQAMAAAEYASAYPKKGRPHPSKGFKRMLSELEWPESLDADESESTGAADSD